MTEYTEGSKKLWCYIYEMMQFLLLFDMIQLRLTSASNLMVIYASVFLLFMQKSFFIVKGKLFTQKQFSWCEKKVWELHMTLCETKSSGKSREIPQSCLITSKIWLSFCSMISMTLACEMWTQEIARVIFVKCFSLPIWQKLSGNQGFWMFKMNQPLPDV